MEITIVSNVEKPAARHNRSGRTAIYPFAKMNIGQSFKILFNSEDVEEREKIARRIRTATGSFRKTHLEFYFETWTALTTDGPQEADGDGVRVRRVAKSARRAKENVAVTTVLTNGTLKDNPSLSA